MRLVGDLDHRGTQVELRAGRQVVEAEIQIEEELEKLVGSTEDGKPQVAVTAVPDERKGERLIILHTKLTKSVDELRKGLTAAGLPNLFVPGADGFIEVESLPILGSGKLDLKAIKAMALERCGNLADRLSAAER